MRATDEFRDYTSGIFSQFVFNLVPNHVVVLVGWGEEDGERYAFTMHTCTLLNFYYVAVVLNLLSIEKDSKHLFRM